MPTLGEFKEGRPIANENAGQLNELRNIASQVGSDLLASAPWSVAAFRGRVPTADQACQHTFYEEGPSDDFRAPILTPIQ
jgi:hypothetical protein